MPADHHAIREVVVAAYRQYARELTPEAYTRYLADLLDLDRHAQHGHLSSRTWADESSDQAPTTQTAPSRTLAGHAGWAGGRALAVHPDARGRGVARALLTTSEHLARRSRAPVFAFHTGSFMTGAIALYENSDISAPRNSTST